jgi:2-keto-4-pentenoate hydratase/2-oxohepta-3-ene-1,7-dioic acid hydratase in catechol pathway
VSTVGKVICVGLNYWDHAEEAKMRVPATPLLFAKWPTALCAEGDPILLPADSTQIDYEGELAVRIGRTCRNVGVTDALDYVDAYACFNDVSARDIQFAEDQWTRAKSFDSFGPCGSFVAAAEVGDPGDLEITTTLNGETVQHARTSEMIFSVPELVAFASRDTTLQSGDLIATGTPAGIGLRRNPPVFLTEGDEVSVSVGRVGTLTNPVHGQPSG